MDRLTWNPLLSPALVGLALGGLAALALAAAWRTRQSWPLWANACAAALRLLALGCAALLILRPESVQRESRETRPPMLVLVDDTQSLRLRDEPGGGTRAESAQPALIALLKGAAARNWEVLAYDAGPQVKPRHPDDDELRASGDASPLGEALFEAQALAADSSGKPPAAAVLFSDGVVNRGRPLADAAAECARAGTAFYAVALGKASPLPPDAALSEARVRRDAEDDATAEILAGTEHRAGQRLLVEARAQLFSNGPALSGALADTDARLQVLGPLGANANDASQEFREAAVLRHRVAEAPGWTPVRLRFVPKAPGFYRLRLSLDPLHGERYLANNVAYASVEVFPPKRHVVYVASRLGHDYRRLRLLFAGWASESAETVADFVRPEPAAGDSPAPWPAEQVLAAKLDEAVPAAARAGTLIWEEPDVSHLAAPTQARLRAALESGELGIVWVLNEPAEELAKKLAGSPLADTFLFQNFQPPDTEIAPSRAPHPVRSSPEARAHPVTAWAFREAAQGADPFQALGATMAWGELSSPREGTTVLLYAGNRPLLAVGTVGRGRVALLAAGETWRWLQPAADSTGRAAAPALAAELWSRLAAWASGSGASFEPPVRLYRPKHRFELDEPLRVSVSVHVNERSEKLRVEYALTRLGAGTAPAEWKPFGAIPGGRRNFLSGTAGRPNAAGEWLVQVRALHADGKPIGTDRAQIVVEGSALEERSVQPDRAGLEAAAQAGPPASNGRVLGTSKDEVQSLLEDLDARMQPEVVWTERRSPAVPRGWLTVLLVLALLVDAWLRRG